MLDIRVDMKQPAVRAGYAGVQGGAGILSHAGASMDLLFKNLSYNEGVCILGIIGVSIEMIINQFQYSVLVGVVVANVVIPTFIAQRWFLPTHTEKILWNKQASYYCRSGRKTFSQTRRNRVS